MITAELTFKDQRETPCNMNPLQILWKRVLSELTYSSIYHNVVMVRSLYSARFSPDGKTIVTTSRNIIAIIWDAESGRKLHSLEGH